MKHIKRKRVFFDTVRDALCGLRHTIYTERNFRREIFIACIVLPGVFFLPLTMLERAGAWACVVIVLVAELFNTALERAVDVATQEYSELARQAKDTAAAAVLIVSISVALYGGMLVWVSFVRLS